MASGKHVTLIQNNADEITRRLCKDLLGRDETRSYHRLNQDVVYERAYGVYSRLDLWLKGSRTHASEIRDFFVRQGKMRYREGIPLHEEIMVLLLIKRHLWLFILDTNFFDSTYELQEELRFNNRVVLFFDRVIYYVTTGYETEMLEAGKGR
ncbi:MAG TPA: hypothetical protein PKM41_12805 [Deltaproteobacteria bacterium]|jgi:hypothetical protein|nr:hypothetical protein [Deltaproteobacteria bacterium]HOI07913.1 hypothetical protein [Deltaproteobacteria bacterium]